MHEGLARIARPQPFPQPVRRLAIGKLDIDGGEDAPVHRRQMRGEADRDGRPRRLAEPLFDLRRMAVPADAVGVDAVLHFREQDVLAAATARPR